MNRILILLACLWSIGMDASTNFVTRPYAPRLWVNRGVRETVFYVANYGSLAATMTNTFPAGAIVDGGNQVYYERLDVPTNNITIRNMILDGTVSLNGSWTFNGANYSETAAWTLLSGEIYKKTCTRTPYQFSEDGIWMTPRVCSDEADVTSNLQRGEFSQVGNALYVRASDGANVSTHNYRGVNRSWDSYPGIVHINGCSSVTLNNVHVRYSMPNNEEAGAFYVTNSSSIVLSQVSATNCIRGINIDSCENITFQNSTVVSNTGGGIVLQGSSTNIYILSNLMDLNGRVKFYNHLTYEYAGDDDGGGIGGRGGYIKNVVVGSCTISSNGPPDYDSTLKGSGWYIGTTSDMLVDGFTFTNNLVKNNHLYGLYGGSSTQCSNVVVAGNVFAWNSRVDSANKHCLVISQATGASTRVANNLLAYNECTNTSAAFYLNNTVTTGSIVCTNNASYNNGGAGSYIADFWAAVTMAGKTNIVEDYNTFQRVSAWDTIKVARNGSTTYGITQLSDWQSATGQGAHDDWKTTGPGVNPTTLPFVFTP